MAEDREETLIGFGGITRGRDSCRGWRNKETSGTGRSIRARPFAARGDPRVFRHRLRLLTVSFAAFHPWGKRANWAAAAGRRA